MEHYSRGFADGRYDRGYYAPPICASGFRPNPYHRAEYIEGYWAGIRARRAAQYRSFYSGYRAGYAAGYWAGRRDSYYYY